MNNYRACTIDIALKSSIGTPLQSDTLFGHICWAIRFLWGEEKLQNFLALYENRESPPLLISNGFPNGWIPKPVISPVPPAALDEIVKKESRIGASYEIKALKKASLLPKDIFLELQEGAITPKGLFETMYKRREEILSMEEMFCMESIQHNTIDRIKGTARDGGLFSHEELFFKKGANEFEVYLKTDSSGFQFDLENIFRYIGESGFGSDKSTGKGHFTFNIREGIDLPEAENPNAFMTLSSYIPHSEAPTKGNYRTLHKYGKLGGTYAQGSPEIFKNPFKKPLLMFAAGSTFYDPDFKSGKIYGSLLKDVHVNESIRHYAYAFPVGIRLEE